MPARSVYRWENPPGKGPVCSSPTIQGGAVRTPPWHTSASWRGSSGVGAGRRPALGSDQSLRKGGGSVSPSPGGAGRGAAGRPAGARSRTSDRTHVRHRPRHVTGPASDMLGRTGQGSGGLGVGVVQNGHEQGEIPLGQIGDVSLLDHVAGRALDLVAASGRMPGAVNRNSRWRRPASVTNLNAHGQGVAYETARIDVASIPRGPFALHRREDRDGASQDAAQARRPAEPGGVLAAHGTAGDGGLREGAVRTEDTRGPRQRECRFAATDYGVLQWMAAREFYASLAPPRRGFVPVSTEKANRLIARRGPARARSGGA